MLDALIPIRSTDSLQILQFQPTENKAEIME